MGQKAERVVYPFTFVFAREGTEWSALACEVDVASCGGSIDEAREGLKEAVGLYVSYMIENGLRDELARPVSKEELAELCRGEHEVEYHAMIVDILPRPAPQPVSMEFVRSGLTPADCRYELAGQ